MFQPYMTREIDAAIEAHGLWKARLRSAVRAGVSEISSEIACRDDRCAFGAWLSGASFAPDLRQKVGYQRVRMLHAVFHQAAGRVVAYVEAGNREAAVALLQGEFAERSEELIAALREWKQQTAKQTVATGW